MNWNSLRHSFGFYIPPVSRTSGAPGELASTGKPRCAKPSVSLSAEHHSRYCYDNSFGAISGTSSGCASASAARAAPWGAQLHLAVESGSPVTPGQSAMGCTHLCNPRRYWLAAMRVFAKLPKLFQLGAKTASLYASPVTRVQSHPEVTTPAKPLQRKAYRAPRFSGLCRNCSSFGVFVQAAPSHQISEAAARSSRAGVSASDFGQHALHARAEGDPRPSEDQQAPQGRAGLWTLNLTEEQFKDVAFAVLCQHGALADSHEANDPEVVAAMNRLNEVQRMCIELENGRTV